MEFDLPPLQPDLAAIASRLGSIDRELKGQTLSAAVEGKTLILAHIDECNRKHKDIMDLVKEVRVDVALGASQMRKANYMVIALLIGSLGYYLARFGLPGHG